MSDQPARTAAVNRPRPGARGLAWVVLPLALVVGVVPASATFPGGNGLIAFDSDRVDGGNDDGNFEIFTMRPDGSEVTPLTDDGGNFAPSWSADGGRIAWEDTVEEEGSPFDDSEIAVMDVDGSDRRLVTNTTPAFEYAPTWSPDGSKIAFSRAHMTSERDHIYAIGSDGTGETQLTDDEDDPDSQPDWSPDGSQIAFARYRVDESGQEIWLMNADGSNERAITDVTETNDSEPSWSPDGTRIAFVRDSADGQAIWVMDADGSDARDVTEPSGDHADRWPAWSPDGSRIVFTREHWTDTTSGSKLYTVDPNGSGEPQPVLDDSETTWDEQPSWQATEPPATEPPPPTTTPPAQGGNSRGGAQQQQQPPPCVVPKLKGVKLRVAGARLAASNCTPGKVTRKRHRQVRRGRVTRSSPRAGAVLSNGAAVALVVSRGRR